MDYHLELLKIRAKELGPDVLKVANIVLNDERFPVWSGSGKPHNHHYFDGGLVKHTFEVVSLCFVNRNALNLINMDEKELFFSALFHDAGKMFDYQKVDDVWGSAPHKRNIHHISRSALIWSHAVKLDDTLNANYHDSVLHAILSHHGLREWGSPVAPKSRVAWLLHLCDGISARMDDYHKHDIVDE